MSDPETFHTLHPFYLEGAAGRLFCVFHQPEPPASPRTKAVVFFPPFTEELNKSRRMIALQARRFARLGLATLVVDLYGTGDSEGELPQADWSIWQSDMAVALAWLTEQGYEKAIFWGLRLGCTLAVELAKSHSQQVAALLLWQPIANAQVYLNQFLRLKLAAELFSDSKQNTVTTKDLRQQLQAGASLEIAGYEISPALADSIEHSSITDLSPLAACPVFWFDVVAGEHQTMTAVNKKLAQQWLDQGVQLQTDTAVGEAFWSTPEIAVLPSLLRKTTDIIQREFAG